MASGHVLRFPRSDREGAFVIVQATPTRSKALDVKLVGTDGVEPYAVSLRHDKIASLRVKNSPCSEEEWVSILTSVISQDPANDVEVVASVEDESSITLTVRKKGKEFSQRLGAIELSHSPRELIELYDWCGLSVQTANEAKEALASATAKASQLEETVRDLQAHLEELVAAKEANETELLEKFCLLLNEKKLKIRQQQLLLASVSANPGRLASPAVKEENPTQEPNLPRQRAKRAPAKSRQSKRKEAPAPIEEDDSDDGFERMNVDSAAKSATNASDQERDTTEDEDATASEDEDDEPVVASSSSTTAPARQPLPAREKPKPANVEAPPPKRELPFAKKKQAPAKPPPPPAGSETESDDEL
ncbi:hypothetical protein CkaCkLH20_04862 [Colletotrichum karsti]|uniref:XRCC4 coiled-coil domain-containing protein n=1 Tax=Colletotrichum karsti TaxID=1095194 RepID=A0A9P6LMP7_9PEZI|nr:uncharacterized protein CkaCkLH20_04862 [Colletotrichum karsti]KAF9877727.1 hypothetical protein CkaCkLH20_04862 [Colletotrichum karsti]